MLQNYTSQLITWLNNLKQNKLNDEILCIFLEIKKVDNFENFLSKRINILKDTFTKNNINSSSYEIFDSQNFDNLSKIKSDLNNIIICNIGMDILKINDCNSKLICVLFNDLITKKPDFQSNIEYIYINKQEPLFLLKEHSIKSEKENNIAQNYSKAYYNYNTIYNMIFLAFKYYGNIKSFKSDNLLASKFFVKELEYDIDVLCYRNILTSKLAIALYKITTLKFNDSNTKIGTYYKKNLGITSKTTQLPNFEKEKIIIKMLREKKIEISPLEAVNYYNKNKDKFEEKEIKYISNLPIFRAKAYNLNKATLL